MKHTAARDECGIDTSPGQGVGNDCGLAHSASVVFRGTTKPQRSPLSPERSWQKCYVEAAALEHAGGRVQWYCVFSAFRCDLVQQAAGPQAGQSGGGSTSPWDSNLCLQKEACVTATAQYVP